MRCSKYYLPTYKEVPADAEIPSHRLMLRAGMIRKLTSGVYSFLPAGLKVLKRVERIVRKYFKLTPRIILAGRYITRNSYGDDGQVFYLGGPWTLRGYGFREFFGRSIHLVNTEIRFPLIDRFALMLPFGLIEMPMFRGALFFDFGRTLRNNLYFFDTELVGSFGAGVELNLGFAPVIRVNFTRRTDFATVAPTTGFELFIGYNY